MQAPSNEHDHRALLRDIARRAMIEHHLAPEFPPHTLQDVALLTAAVPSGVRDLRDRLWCSIDNDDSMDLDQLTVSSPGEGGAIRILVAVADVDVLVPKDSSIDHHARQNTTSVYTAAQIFPMLPERLSTDLTSLAFGEDRAAMVIDMAVAPDGTVADSNVYAALVHNRAKLAYNSVADWLDGRGPMPAGIAAVAGMEEQLRVQDRVAALMDTWRHAQGALEFETIEARAVFDGHSVHALQLEQRNRAKTIIENFMIGANGATARFLAARRLPSLRRIVRTPARWDRIVELAAQHGGALPAQPDGQALQQFLAAQKARDPVRFPDLSLAIIKLLGPGEYVVERPGETVEGHFGLAVRDYSHSTAPNRRFPDLVTQRLLKAALFSGPVAYGDDELEVLAAHCTEMEDEANKVERLVRKAAAALLLESRIGEEFDAIVTGASPKGTWVRLFDPPVEGRLERGFEGLDVGDRVRVRLLSTDAMRGFIDFGRAQPPPITHL
jgi:VacB/RNase II family 3'-5' exoribonuclease